MRSCQPVVGIRLTTDKPAEAPDRCRDGIFGLGIDARRWPARLPGPGDVVEFLPRDIADAGPALIRTAAHLIPAVIDPLRIFDIVGLDREADGGTHVLSTAEVGR
jgi:misacylated tRNA(Ala) deacylase